MEQRLAMAQAEQDPNVSHYAMADVAARTADPVAWEKAQMETIPDASDEDLQGKIQLLPQALVNHIQTTGARRVAEQLECDFGNRGRIATPHVA